jgi:hypothetical protein
LGLVEREGEGKRHPVEHALGIHRDHAIGERVHIADVLVRHIIGRMPLLAVARLVNAEEERRLAERLTQRREPAGAQRRSGPVDQCGVVRK